MTNKGRADSSVGSDTEVLYKTLSEIEICQEKRFLRWLWNKAMAMPGSICQVLL